MATIVAATSQPYKGNPKKSEEHGNIFSKYNSKLFKQFSSLLRSLQISDAKERIKFVKTWEKEVVVEEAIKN